MKISIFVHELLPQIGHSRAMIELLNGLTPEQKNQVIRIEAVSCESGDLEEIFSTFNCAKKWVKIPGKGLKPFILKMFVYHIFSYFYSTLFCHDKIKIGIGIACLNVDISNIQFVHEQWKSQFFKNKSFNPLALIYKKILFQYFKWGEEILFRNPKIHFICVAKFIQEYLPMRFGTHQKNTSLIYSGVNTKEFNVDIGDYETVLEEMLEKYPQLQKINFSEPVPLFVGAFERKGLNLVFDYLKHLPNSQLIVVGKPESFGQWVFPEDIRIAYIPHTKEIQKFYFISDLFIFPTLYEPFGLVILEAFAMGLDLIVPEDNVGASEILPRSEGIYFFNQNAALPMITFKKINLELKKERNRHRIQALQNYTWEESSQIFYSILSKN